MEPEEYTFAETDTNGDAWDEPEDIPDHDSFDDEDEY